MDFTALGIKDGDAFLVKDDKKIILFDAGNGSLVINTLILEGVQSINIAICSHNDADHAKGFIALLKPESKIFIEEIWLPGFWSSILLFIIEEIILKPDYRIPELNLKHKEILEGFKNHLNNNEIIDSKESFKKLEQYSDELNTFFEDNIHELEFYSHISHSFSKPISIKLGNIVNISRLALKRGTKIRWFQLSEYERNNQKAINGLLPKNSQEMFFIPKITIKELYSLIVISNENKYALVFEYLINGNPRILFCSDSKLDFIINPLNYNHNSMIVTVPHHGSQTNDKVYNKIEGSCINWVRSSKRKVKNISNLFFIKQNKFCLQCINRKKKPTRFQFINGVWDFKDGNKCNCKQIFGDLISNINDRQLCLF